MIAAILNSIDAEIDRREAKQRGLLIEIAKLKDARTALVGVETIIEPAIIPDAPVSPPVVVVADQDGGHDGQGDVGDVGAVEPVPASQDVVVEPAAPTSPEEPRDAVEPSVVDTDHANDQLPDATFTAADAERHIGRVADSVIYTVRKWYEYPETYGSTDESLPDDALSAEIASALRIDLKTVTDIINHRAPYNGWGWRTTFDELPNGQRNLRGDPFDDYELEAIRASDLNQIQLEDACYVSRSTIGNILRGDGIYRIFYEGDVAGWQDDLRAGKTTVSQLAKVNKVSRKRIEALLQAYRELQT